MRCRARCAWRGCLFKRLDERNSECGLDHTTSMHSLPTHWPGRLEQGANWGLLGFAAVLCTRVCCYTRLRWTSAPANPPSTGLLRRSECRIHTCRPSCEMAHKDKPNNDRRCHCRVKRRDAKRQALGGSVACLCNYCMFYKKQPCDSLRSISSLMLAFL